MASLKTITGTFTGPDGNGIACQVKAVLSQACTVPGTQEVIQNAARVFSNPSGVFSLSLYANNDLTPTSTSYTVTAVGNVDGASVVSTWTIVVPQSPGPFEISNLLAVPPPVPSPPGALDSQVVHLALTETITGVKRFNAGLDARSPVRIAGGKPWYDPTHPDYGAGGHTQGVNDGVMNGTTAVLTSATGAFVVGDVGSFMQVPGAGAAGATLVTTIASYQSATQVTLAAVSQTAVGAAQILWGTYDDVALQSVLTTLQANFGGVILTPYGTYALQSQLNITTYGHIIWFGMGSTLKPVSGWAGTTIINCTQNNCTFRDLNFQPGYSQTYTLNPAADCLTFKGANNNRVNDCTGYYWNGWFINCIPNGTANPLGNFYTNVVGTSGKQGIHFQGSSTGSYSVGAELTNVFMNHMQAGDALFIDGAHDVVSEGFFAVLDGPASAFNCIHIKGTSAGIFMSFADCGGVAGGAYTGTAYLIERDGSLNRPNNVQFIGGITSNQGIGLSVDCDDFTCDGHTFLQSQFDGCQIVGAGTNLTFLNNRYQQSNLSAGTNYDVRCTNTTGQIMHKYDFFESTGTTACVFAQSNMEIMECYHAHASQAWANATPHHRSNSPINGAALPSVPSTPGVPATTVAQVNNRQADCTVYVTAGAGSTCAVQIHGTTVATLPASGIGGFTVPDGSSITLTYTSAPTWVWVFAIRS